MISMLDAVILFIVGMALGAGIVAFLWLSVIEKAKEPGREVAIDAWLIAHRFSGRPTGYDDERMEKEARHWWKAWQSAFVCAGKKKEAEPWHTIEGVDRQWRLHSETVSHLATMGNPGEANARRIVACVNACAGIPDEVLTAPDYSIKAELDTLDEQIARRLNAEEERNRLYARLLALEEVATDVEAYIDVERVAVPDVYTEHLRDELIRTRNALGILPEQDAVRPKGDHDAQHPGQLFDLDEIKKGNPAGQCRCLLHPVPPEPSARRVPEKGVKDE